jgi:chemotaxis protein MotB
MSDPLFDEDEVPTWIFTFADLMSLLLVFFILMYSLSKMTETTLEAALSSIQIALSSNGANINQSPRFYSGGGTQVIKPEPPQLADNQDLTFSEEPIDTEEREQVNEIANDIANKMISSNLSNAVSVFEDGEKITIRVDGQTLFDSGDSQLSYEAEFIFNKLIDIFNRYPEYSISIQGHTDNIPINTVKYPSNWELSAIRATTALRYFLAAGFRPERMTATGYADSIPLVRNDTPENRAINRRAEFVLQKDPELQKLYDK